MGVLTWHNWALLMFHLRRQIFECFFNPFLKTLHHVKETGRQPSAIIFTGFPSSPERVLAFQSCSVIFV